MRRLRRSSSLGVLIHFITILIALAAMAVTSEAAQVHFGKPIVYNLDSIAADSVAVGDLNGDGHPDLVVTTSCADPSCIGHVGVLLGNGDGTFQSPVSYNLIGIPGLSIAIGDLNGDRRPDLVVAGDWEFAVLIGNGDGTFQSPTYHIPVSGWFTTQVSIGDVDGDGRLDLILSCGSLSQQWAMSVLLGNGDGTFQAAVMYDTGLDSVSRVVTADVNDDGYADAVVTGSGAHDNRAAVSLLLANGNGTFRAAVTYHSTGNLGSASGTSVAVADVNSDGKLDLVVANSNVVGVLLGNGDGSFQPAIVYNSGSAYSVAVVDVNGDGKLDIVATSGGKTVGVLLGNGDGSFQPPIRFSSGGGFGTSLVIADVNGITNPT